MGPSMLGGLLKKVFGSKNSRELKRMDKIVRAVNAIEPQMQSLEDADFPLKTEEYRKRFADGESLDQLLPEAFALIREIARRVSGTRHFDTQLIGGITLHEGRIAEMRTGEGKTQVATLAAYLNALSGKSVHIVTTNDYLARRDAGWMGPMYTTAGLSVGIIQSGQSGLDKQEAYGSDITYGTNNEFGFDYLRDNMAFTVEDRIQRGLNFAIVDEVDSILIDEARTPLIISGPTQENTELYLKINSLVPKLKAQIGLETDELGIEEDGDYILDEKSRSVELTEAGHEKVEAELQKMGLLEEHDSLYSATNLGLLHHVHAALKAHIVFKRDVDYMVQGNEIMIVDEHTGRAMPGRRWSEGIHQAVEAKEGVSIQNESQTLASTTFQNYFRLYSKLSGMTGTADTEAFEFNQIYNLQVVVIPTNKDMVRDDANDLLYSTVPEKYDAIVVDIESRTKSGQPVLVGTASIESSELLSNELKKRKIEHSLLNARQHEMEADIIAQAGMPGVVTIATNMAGRGTDIVLGGNLEAALAKLDNPDETERADAVKKWQALHNQVLEAGGLHIIGTERHESRRIDNQLRGRSGRQGDPGSSRFYLSMQDNLMRIFASERMRGMMTSLGLEKGESLEHKMVSNAIEKAQRKVEGHNFDIRKNLLEFDDVANDQRQVIYQQRNDLMEAEDISEMLSGIREEVVLDVISAFIPFQTLEEQWDLEGLEEELKSEFSSVLPLRSWLEADDDLNEDTLRIKVVESVQAAYTGKEVDWKTRGIDIRLVEKQLMLQILDQLWKEHLATMDHLRQGIHLRAYAQKQPKQEYKRESFELFQELLQAIKHDIVRLLSRVQIESDTDVEKAEQERRLRAAQRMKFQHQEVGALNSPDGGGDAPPDTGKTETFVRQERKIGRNESCPCGSGKKYKHCHGQA